MRSIYINDAGEIHLDITIEEISKVLAEGTGNLWVDLSHEVKNTYSEVLEGVFRFHPLAVDDALRETHSPKVDDWETYLYVVLNVLGSNGTKLDELPELDVFLGVNYLVTFHTVTIPALEKVWALSRQDDRFKKQRISYWFYMLVDEVANDLMKLTDDFEAKFEKIDFQIFADLRPDTLEMIFDVKRELLYFRRALLPQREVFNKLARNEYQVIPKKYRVFFRDVYDHYVRLYEIVESLRDLVSGAMDTYLSVVNNRMNDVMKTLTIFTTLFLPLTFLTGFFGMNFFQADIDMHFWTGKLAFILLMAGMVVVPVVMFIFIRRRRWM